MPILTVPTLYKTTGSSRHARITHYGPASTYADLRGQIYVRSRALCPQSGCLQNEEESIYGPRLAGIRSWCMLGVCHVLISISMMRRARRSCAVTV